MYDIPIIPQPVPEAKRSAIYCVRFLLLLTAFAVVVTVAVVVTPHPQTFAFTLQRLDVPVHETGLRGLNDWSYARVESLTLPVSNAHINGVHAVSTARLAVLEQHNTTLSFSTFNHFPVYALSASFDNAQAVVRCGYNTTDVSIVAAPFTMDDVRLMTGRTHLAVDVSRMFLCHGNTLTAVLAPMVTGVDVPVPFNPNTVQLYLASTSSAEVWKDDQVAWTVADWVYMVDGQLFSSQGVAYDDAAWSATRFQTTRNRGTVTVFVRRVWPR